jgi:hypothetical protein
MRPVTGNMMHDDVVLMEIHGGKGTGTHPVCTAINSIAQQGQKQIGVLYLSLVPATVHCTS